MKQITLLFLLITSLFAKSQTTGSNNIYTGSGQALISGAYIRDRLWIPRYSNTPTLVSGQTDYPGFMFYNTTSNLPVVRGAGSWYNLVTDSYLSGQLGSYVPSSRTLTINGTTYDLSTNRSWTIPLFTGGALLTDITYSDAASVNGIKWLKNTDYGKINFHSNSDTDSELRFIVGDNEGNEEKFVFLKDTGGLAGVTAYKELLRVSDSEFKYKGQNIAIGGVESFNGRKGAVTAQSGDYEDFYLTKETDSVKFSNIPYDKTSKVFVGNNAASGTESVELLFRNSSRYSNVAAFQSTSDTGYSAIAFRDKLNFEHMAVGYDASTVPILPTHGAAFIETSTLPTGNPATEIPPPFKVFQSGNIGGSGWAQHQRFVLDSDGLIHFYNLLDGTPDVTFNSLTSAVAFKGQITAGGPLVFNSTNGQYISFSTASSVTSLHTNTFNITGSGSKTDFNSYVYGNNEYNVWTNNVKRLSISGTGNLSFTGDGSFTGTVSVATPTAGGHAATKDYVDAAVSTGATSGTYTPTITNGTGVGYSLAHEFGWQRIGNRVTVTGVFETYPTSASPTVVLGVGISLPIASNFTSQYNLSGTETTNHPDVTGRGMWGDTATDVANVTFVSNTTSTAKIYVNFMYTVL